MDGAQLLALLVQVNLTVAASIILFTAYCLTRGSLDFSFGAAHRVVRLLTLRYTLFGSCWIVWCIVGTLISSRVLPLAFKWFTPLCAVLAFACEAVVFKLATGQQVFATIFGRPERYPASLMRLVGAVSLLPITWVTNSFTELAVHTVWSFCVGLLFILPVVWPRFPEGTPTGYNSSRMHSLFASSSRTSAPGVDSARAASLRSSSCREDQNTLDIPVNQGHCSAGDMQGETAISCT